ncbi:MAG TPA: FKBP-type peptidyl-prolyl cis-trans isomerase [Polyangiaceae bacterium]|nr:FKBP-type peptidyl-prolyl cis-trans isomerase [Polyangiaceae bacterium]
MRYIAWVVCAALGVVGCKSKMGSAPSEETSASAAPSAVASAVKTPNGMPGALVKALPAPPDVAAPPADAQKTPSGLATKVLQAGTGTDHPRPQDRVRVNYTGWTKQGEMFDSSVARGMPASFEVNRVIPGWTEGLQLMVAGEKRRFWIPASLAYGEHPMGNAPAGDLVFDVELLGLTKAPDPPPVPEDVAAPPKTAKKTKSGLAYRVLKPGTGKQPKPTDVVSVNYSGWTTDGHMFDSSVMRGRPLTARLDQVIKGWTEAVPLMKVGEKARFWIPAELAYGEKPTRPGAPAGMLVFDIELLEIKEAPPVANPNLQK